MNRLASNELMGLKNYVNNVRPIDLKMAFDLQADAIKAEYAIARDFGDGSGIKDDFHTMSELYFHRMILFLKLGDQLSLSSGTGKPWVFRSKLHADGTMFDGYFICGISMDGTLEHMYTYHYDMRYWDLFFNWDTLKFAPEYNGHQPGDLHFLNTALQY